MTVPVSTVPAAKSALFAAIKAAVDSDVLVCWDHPGTNQPPDIICVSGVQRIVESHAMVGSGGAGWLDEIYHLGVAISVFRGTDDAQGTDLRVWTLIAQIEQAVRNDPTLAGTVLEARPTETKVDGGWEATHKGRLVEAELAIRCNAVI